MSKKMSIIVPIYNEEKYIENCIESILASDYNQNNMDILLIDGGSCDNTLKIIKEYQKKYSNIRLLHNPKKIVPISMNIGIKEASGEYVIRLDAHASYPKEYFTKLIYWHQKLDADNVGSLIETKVKNLTPVSSAIKKVLSNKFGVGSTFRSGGNIQEPILVDTVPFGCYKKDVFEKYGLYDERLVRNQDIELNKRIINGGGKIYLVPDVKCTYFARETYKSLAKNNFSNGLWNILTAYYTNSFNSLSLRHFIPLLFVLGIIAPIFMSLLYFPIIYISLLVIASHLGLILYQSLKMVDKKTTLLKLMYAFYTLHLSYGVGSIVGIFEVVKKKLI